MAFIRQLLASAVEMTLRGVEGSDLLPERLYIGEPDHPHDEVEIMRALPGLVGDLQGSNHI